MKPVTDGLSGVLLAGGKSRRMGCDKRFLAVGGRPLVERTLAVFVATFPEVLVVVAGPAAELAGSGYRVVTDAIPDCGSLGGLYTGLSHATYSRVFAAACDMPFLDAAVIRYLAGLDPGADLVIPRLAAGLQPMHAIYSKNCLPHLRHMIDSGNLRLHELASTPGLLVNVVPQESIRSIDPDLLSFVNVNRPADLELARQLDAGRNMREKNG